MRDDLRDQVDQLAQVPRTGPLGWLLTLALVVATVVALCGDVRRTVGETGPRSAPADNHRARPP